MCSGGFRKNNHYFPVAKGEGKVYIKCITYWITPPNPPWLKFVLSHYSRGAVWRTVIQAELGPHTFTLCKGTASQQWLMGGGGSLGISF